MADVQVNCLYDFEGDEYNGELSFVAGETLSVIRQTDKEEEEEKRMKTVLIMSHIAQSGSELLSLLRGRENVLFVMFNLSSFVTYQNRAIASSQRVTLKAELL
ncbi:hypothetical protein PoB_001379000 [Plakobranchus ocellatus]|uniref:SH3 domain-containing protein n=1 Tax=Plakobranchus ocellatus TaxID=259542 RepID=A0AAV3YWL3_9GAST|nr:hypothetical protein PoB_001379000 [Plakobranchus ocellatus]